MKIPCSCSQAAQFQFKQSALVIHRELRWRSLNLHTCLERENDESGCICCATTHFCGSNWTITEKEVQKEEEAQDSCKMCKCVSCCDIYTNERQWICVVAVESSAFYTHSGSRSDVSLPNWKQLHKILSCYLSSPPPSALGMTGAAWCVRRGSLLARWHRPGHLRAADVGRWARNFNPGIRPPYRGSGRGSLWRIGDMTGRRHRGHVIESAVSARAVTAFDKVLGGPWIMYTVGLSDGECNKARQSSVTRNPSDV